VLFCFLGCTTVSINKFTNDEYIPPYYKDPQKIKILHSGHPIDRPYDELAEIILRTKKIYTN
jgi:hypothetical protein